MNTLDTVLGRFAPTPAEVLAVAALQRRTDTKFVTMADALAGLLEGLDEGYTLLYTADRRIAEYRTLYFDTPDLAFFHAHRRGYRRRRKVRIRHYPDRNMAFLEVKERLNAARTVKTRVEISCGDGLFKAIDLSVLGMDVNAAGPLQPQVWTNFQRITLVGREGSERVTLDSDLRFEWEVRSRQLQQCAVIEVKQAEFNRHTPVMIALRKAGIRPGSFSKYCAAMAGLYPDLRRNSLRPFLRIMERMEHAQFPRA
jgi:hypothetical protein